MDNSTKNTTVCETDIKIVSGDMYTSVYVGDRLVMQYSSPSMLMVPIEGYNAAFGSMMSLIFAEHILKYGRQANG